MTTCPTPDGKCPCVPEEPPSIFWDSPWWTPEGIGTWEDVQMWYAEETYRNCPYYIASNGGPKDLPGKYGPGTCLGGCWEEPRCITG